MSFVDEHKNRRVQGGLRWGVEPICAVLTEHNLAIAPATYYAAKTRAPSPRAVRDLELKTTIERVHAANYGVYGVRKMHAALRRDGVEIGRDQTGRLMRELGLAGARRGKFKRTTTPDATAGRPADLVNREFRAARPDQLWVCDLTYIRTWTGFGYLALVIDVFSRRVVGWSLAGHMRTELPLEALELAIWTRQQHGLDGLIHHTDAGSQGGLNRSSQHLTIPEVCDGTTSAASRQGSSAGDALAWSADPGPACAARVLAPDRIGQAQRRRCAGGRRVCAGWDPLVSSRWRHAAFEPCRADRPVLVLPRA